MVIDITFFGYGAGLVMVGFTAGMIGNFLMQSIRGLRRI